MSEVALTPEAMAAEDQFAYTTPYGDIYLREDRLITFPQGLLGFSHCTVFGLACHPKHPDSPVMILQCVNDPKINFTVVDARSVGIDYTAEDMADATAATGLDMTSSTMLVVLRAHGDKDQSSITANKRAPIVIDSQALKAQQLILKNKEYSTQFKL